MYRGLTTYVDGAPVYFLVHTPKECVESLDDGYGIELAVRDREQLVAIADACNKADHVIEHEGKYGVVVSVDEDIDVCVAEGVSKELAELIVSTLGMKGRVECIE